MKITTRVKAGGSSFPGNDYGIVRSGPRDGAPRAASASRGVFASGRYTPAATWVRAGGAAALRIDVAPTITSTSFFTRLCSPSCT